MTTITAEKKEIIASSIQEAIQELLIVNTPQQHIKHLREMLDVFFVNSNGYDDSDRDFFLYTFIRSKDALNTIEHNDNDLIFDIYHIGIAGDFDIFINNLRVMMDVVFVNCDYYDNSKREALYSTFEAMTAFYEALKKIDSL